MGRLASLRLTCCWTRPSWTQMFFRDARSARRASCLSESPVLGDDDLLPNYQHVQHRFHSPGHASNVVHDAELEGANELCSAGPHRIFNSVPHSRILMSLKFVLLQLSENNGSSWEQQTLQVTSRQNDKSFRIFRGSRGSPADRPRLFGFRTFPLW